MNDQKGRYLIVQGSLLSENVNLVNLYGPNKDGCDFFKDLFLTLTTFTAKYIIAGDFNCTLNPSVDRSTGLDQSHSKCRTVIQCLIEKLKLLDVWRELKPHNKAFSCYSSTFNSYSTIDYFHISTDLRPKTHDCFYDNI